MEFERLDRHLRDSLADLRLCQVEREQLRALATQLNQDQLRYMRNRAFALVRELGSDAEKLVPALKWLEQVIKTLDASVSLPKMPQVSAYFTPGDACRRTIVDLLQKAQQQVDICVYTISDDTLSQAIVACHERGVAVRVLSDNDKQYDEGSDIRWMLERGVAVRLDNGEHHMHHKFALFDRQTLLNGSFNWTRSASSRNDENLLVTDHPLLLSSYSQEFERLWKRYG